MNSDEKMAAEHKCSVCGAVKSRDQLIAGSAVRPPLPELIRQDVPHWDETQWICRDDLNNYRDKYLRTILEQDRGAVLKLEAEVLEGLKKQELLSRNLNQTFEQNFTFGQRVADDLARLGGSWNFILGFLTILLAWILLNSLVLRVRPFDPYPFILLNLVLSSLAALQAPVIMMSQNRQEARDRLRAEDDYRINLKAELEIRMLHEKLDYLLLHQWQHLLEVQELQLELIRENATSHD